MDEKKKKNRPKRIIYCERCGHPEDRHDVKDSYSMGCTAKTIKKGTPQCKCPRFVWPLRATPMEEFGRYLAKEVHRGGRLPKPVEGAVK